MTHKYELVKITNFPPTLNIGEVELIIFTNSPQLNKTLSLSNGFNDSTRQPSPITTITTFRRPTWMTTFARPIDSNQLRASTITSNDKSSENRLQWSTLLIVTTSNDLHWRSPHATNSDDDHISGGQLRQRPSLVVNFNDDHL